MWYCSEDVIGPWYCSEDVIGPWYCSEDVFGPWYCSEDVIGPWYCSEDVIGACMCGRLVNQCFEKLQDLASKTGSDRQDTDRKGTIVRTGTGVELLRMESASTL